MASTHPHSVPDRAAAALRCRGRRCCRMQHRRERVGCGRDPPGGGDRCRRQHQRLGQRPGPARRYPRAATSIITNPATDPHDYEPTPRNAVVIARSRLFVENGIGYDSWAARSLAASPDSHRLVLNVGELVGVKAGGNPHRWYSPADVAPVADAITAGLTPPGPGRRRVLRAAAAASSWRRPAPTYDRLIATIRAQYAGIPIGASESVFSPTGRIAGSRRPHAAGLPAGDQRGLRPARRPT